MKLIEKVSFDKNLIRDVEEAKYCAWMVASMTC